MNEFRLEKECSIQLMYYNAEANLLDIRDVDLTFSMVTSAYSNDPLDLAEAQLKQNISFAKASSFVERCLHGSIIFDNVISTIGLTLENNLITVPDVTENTFVASLICKLNSIVDEDTTIHSIKMFDKYDKLKYTYKIEEKDTDYPLPKQTDWLGEYPYWETPWWYRDDITTYDKGATTEEEYKGWQKERKDGNVDKENRIWFEEIEKEVIKLYTEMKNEQETTSPKKGEVISIDFGNKNKQDNT
jgi:hypothetical protein